MESQEHFKAFSYVAQEINSSTGYSISSSQKLKQALQNISNFFTLSSDQNIVRPLFTSLPQDISSSLFGSKDNGKRGLFHSNLQQNDAAYLVDFLKPSGPFIQKLLALQSDPSAIYNISPDYLPPLSRKIVQSGEWGGLLANLYKKSIQSLSSGNGAAPNNGGGMAGAVLPNALSNANPGSSSIRILFNMFEYYMFCFSLCANMVSEKNVELSSRKTSYPPPSLSRFGSVPSGNSSAAMVLDKAYYHLVQSYLAFFLPARPPPIKLAANSPTSPNNPMTPNKSFNAQYGSSRTSIIAAPKQPTTAALPAPVEVLDNSNIFKCTSVENLAHALGTAQFAVEVLAEVWLGLNEWEPESDRSSATLIYAKPQSYIKPSSFQMSCIATLIKYLVSLDLKNISNEQLSRIHCDRSSGQSDVVYDINTAVAYKAIAPKFYRHISLALQHWSRDDSVSEVVDQWLYFAFPWKHGRSSTMFTDDWIPFVAENYLFYTRVLQLFFNRALTFDFYASTRPAATSPSHGISPEKMGKSPHEPAYLKMTERVIAYFSDPKLLDLLKAIETALCSLKTYNAVGGATSGVVSAFSSPVLKSATSSTRLTTTATSAALRKEKIDIGYQFRNSGPKTRQQVIAFEGKYHYSPVFIQIPDAMKDKNSNLPTRLTSLVWEARERLTHFKQARAAAAQKEIDTYNETSTLSSVISIVTTLFSEGPGSSASNAPLTQEQLVAIDKSIDRLETIVDTITDIWGLPNPSQTAPIQFRRTNSDLIGLLQEDMEEESNIKEWAPGVCEPQRVKEIGNVLTLRGRNQIKFGLRKSASEAVPLIQSSRANSLIRGSESKTLVLIANSIAVAFDRKYEEIREHHAYLPEKAGLHWIRFFAAWDNLALVGFAYLLCRWLF